MRYSICAKVKRSFLKERFYLFIRNVMQSAKYAQMFGVDNYDMVKNAGGMNKQKETIIEIMALDEELGLYNQQ